VSHANVFYLLYNSTFKTNSNIETCSNSHSNIWEIGRDYWTSSVTLRLKIRVKDALILPKCVWVSHTFQKGEKKRFLDTWEKFCANCKWSIVLLDQSNNAAQPITIKRCFWTIDQVRPWVEWHIVRTIEQCCSTHSDRMLLLNDQLVCSWGERSIIALKWSNSNNLHANKS